MSPPRILQVAKYYAPYLGGIERVIQDMVEGLRDEFDLRVLACTARPGPHHVENLAGVPVTRVGTQAESFRLPLPLGFYSWYRRLSRDADLIQFHLPFPVADVVATLAGLEGPRSVVWYHSDVVRQAWALGAYGPLLRRFLGKVDRIFVASRGLLETSPFLAQVREKCRLVPYGVSADGPEEPFPLPARDFILFVGRLVAYKGLDVLLDAMRSVAAPLVVVGDGPEGRSLRSRACELGVSDRVFFLGKIPRARLIHCYRACRLLVLPSVDRSEAFGLVQLEAMVRGKPVINTRLFTGVPEVSLHGRSGLTVPPRDADALAGAIRTLLEDPRRYAELAAGAAERARDFGMPAFLDGVRRCYRELLSSV